MSVVNPQNQRHPQASPKDSAGNPGHTPLGPGGDPQIIPINAFVAAANRRADAAQPAVSSQTTPPQGSIAVPAQTGAGGEEGEASLVEKVLFTDTGDGVTLTRYHKFPLPGPLRPYIPEYEKGKYLVPSVTGESMFDTYERATNMAKSVEETAALNNWKIRQVVKGIKSDPGLIAEVNVEDTSWWGKKKVNRMADAAEVLAGSRRAGEFGDCVHAWTAAVEIGQVPFSAVPDDVKPYVEVYFRALAEYGVRTAAGMIERIVYNTLAGCCGSFDRIYVLADGTVVIGDLKTSASIDLAWLAIAIQLALYATSAAILSEDGKEWQRMPTLSQTVAVVAHIPSDADPPRCTMKQVDLTAGRFALDQAINLRVMRDNAIKVIPSDLPKP